MACLFKFAPATDPVINNKVQLSPRGPALPPTARTPHRERRPPSEPAPRAPARPGGRKKYDCGVREERPAAARPAQRIVVLEPPPPVLLEPVSPADLRAVDPALLALTTHATRGAAVVVVGPGLCHYCRTMRSDGQLLRPTTCDLGHNVCRPCLVHHFGVDVRLLLASHRRDWRCSSCCGAVVPDSYTWRKDGGKSTKRRRSEVSGPTSASNRPVQARKLQNDGMDDDSNKHVSPPSPSQLEHLIRAAINNN